MIFPVKRLADLGFEILATEGTAEVLRRNGVDGDASCASTAQGPGPTASRPSSTRILAGEVDLIVNTPYGDSGGAAARRLRDPHRRGRPRHPVHHHRAGARRRRAGHRGAARAGELGVRSLQELRRPT